MNDDVVQVRRQNTEPLRVGTKIFKSAYDWELSEKDLQKAASELGENEDRKKACLQQLKEKLLNDTSVKYRLDDFYLLRFLRVRKYDVNRAYQNMKIFFEQRNKHAEDFIISVSPEMKLRQKMNFLTILPYQDEEDRIVLLLELNKWNTEELTFEQVMGTNANVAALCTMNPKCQVNGIVAIYDLGGLCMRHISLFLSNGRLWTHISLVTNGYPWRIKKLIVINTNRLVRLLFNIVLPFLPRKIRERCFFLGSDMSELHQHVNPVLLPERLKGTLKEEECDSSQHVLDNLPYLIYERSFVCKQ